jgi:hypothetical protein
VVQFPALARGERAGLSRVVSDLPPTLPILEAELDFLLRLLGPDLEQLLGELDP